MKSSHYPVAVVTLLLALGCAGRHLDLGHDTTDTPPPPRLADGSIDEAKPWTIVAREAATLLAVDGGRIYWTTTSVFESCRIDDCAKTLVTYGNVQGTPVIGVSKTDVYWSRFVATSIATQETLATCPIGGCDGKPAVRDIR